MATAATKVAARNDRIDALEEKVLEYIGIEQERLRRQVAFLAQVRLGRGMGRLQAYTEAEMEARLADSVSDFLTR